MAALDVQPTPANLVELLQRLSGGQTSQDENQRLLQVWQSLEEKEGLRMRLYEIFANRELPTEVRLLTVIAFKNSIEKLWTLRNARTKIPDSEKQQIRRGLLEYFVHETNEAVFRQIAATFAKIFRKDYPDQWKELLPTLVKVCINPADSMQQSRAITVLAAVAESVASLRIQPRKIQQASKDLLEFAANLWHSKFSQMLQAIQAALQQGGAANSDELRRSCQETERCTNLLYSLVAMGCPDCDTNPHAQQLFPKIGNVLAVLVDEVFPKVRNSPIEDDVTDIANSLASLVSKSQSRNPLPFRRYLQPFLDYFTKLVASYKFQEHIPKSFIVHALNFIRQVVSCQPYSGSSGAVVVRGSSIAFDKVALQEAQAILADFFNQERVHFITQTLVEVYFPLKSDEIDDWKTDGELFYSESLVSQAHEKVRPAAELLLGELFERFTKTSGTYVMSALQTVITSSTNSPADQQLLMKDAVYHALGIGHYHLHDAMQSQNLDFNRLYQQVFSKELVSADKSGSTGLFIRTRIAWLLGKYSDDISQELRPHVYLALLEMLREEDLVLRLTVVDSFRMLIDNVGFYANQFDDYVQPMFQLSLRLIGDLSEADSRQRVLSTVKILIDQLKEKIVPAAQLILSALQQLWEVSAEQNMLRMEIVNCLTNVVTALSFQSKEIHGFLINVLGTSTDPENKESGYLTEHGFDLWLVVLQNTPTLPQGLSDLFPRWIYHAQASTQYTEVALKILANYILLGGGSFVQLHGSEISKALLSYFNNLIDAGIKQVAKVVSTFVEMFPDDSPRFLADILESIIVRFSKDQNPKTSDASAVMNECLYIFARLFFQSYQNTMELMTKLSERHGVDLLLPMLRLMTDRFESIPFSFRQKVFALALANCLATRNVDHVRLLLPAVFSHSTTVIFQDSDSQIFLPDVKPNPNTTEWTEGDRRRELAQKDPAPTINMRDYVNAKLEECGKLNGLQAIQALVGEVDAAIIQEFKEAPQRQT